MIIPSLTFIYDRKGLSKKNGEGMVELRISAGKVRKYVSTGIKVKPKEWKDGSVVGRKDWHELNNTLQAVKKKASEIVVKMVDDDCLEIAAIPEMLKTQIVQQQTFLDYAREIARKRYKKIAAGTKEHYELWFRFMDEWKGIVYFSDVTEKNVQKMDCLLEQRGLKEVSRWSYHKILKTFIFQAIADGLIEKNPYAKLDIKRGSEDGLVRCLTPTEFHRFEACEIKEESLARVRDLFCFQTYTMMSYSDLAEFDYANCEKMNGQTVYRARRIKTNQPFMVVLLKPALTILRRYGYRLPIISNVKYNLYLKAAVKYAKIDKPVSTHWARHTGATLLLNEGRFPMHVIQHILGHASIRETEKTYAKLMDETIVETMVNYQKKKKVGRTIFVRSRK